MQPEPPSPYQPPYQTSPQYQPPSAPQGYYQYVQPRERERGGIRWVVVLGGIVAFVGALVYTFVAFWYASLDPTTVSNFDSIRWTYQAQGAAELLSGLGIMIAFIGLALRRPD